MTSKGKWRGIPIEELPREELEDALIELGNLYSDCLKRHSEDMKSLLAVEPPRRKSLWERLFG